MLKKLQIVLFVTLFCLKCVTGYSQKFYAQVSTNSIPMGQAMEVAFTMENENMTSFTPPAFKDFQIVGGPNQSSSNSFINGSSSSTISISYYIVARHEGVCTIEAASAKSNYSSYNSKEIKIVVGKGTSSNTNKGPANNATNNAGDVTTEDVSNSVFIKVITNKKEAFIGEPISVVFRLYTDRALYNVEFPKAAAFNGFWKQDIAIDQNQAWKYETVNGRQYAYIDVQKVILFPQKSGSASITPIEMSAVIEQKSKRRARNFYEEFFGSNISVNEVPVHLKSTSINIRVLDFPANAPAGFDGIVGKYTLESTVVKQQVKTDDPFEYKIKLNGAGNFQAISPSVLNLVPALESYDPETKDNYVVDGATLRGNKTFSYLVVAHQPGRYRVGEVSFVCFDPELKKYYTLSTNGSEVEVSGAPSQTTANLNKKGVSNKAKEDFTAIVSNPKIVFQNKPIYLSTPFVVSAFSFPLVCFVALILIKRKREELSADNSFNRKRKASKVASARLIKAKELMQQGASLAFYNELNKTIGAYLCDRLDIPVANFSRLSLSDFFQEKKVSDEIANGFITLIDHCELALFAPVHEQGDLEKSYDQAVSLITLLEDKLK